jgi:hypothetical protein
MTTIHAELVGDKIEIRCALPVFNNQPENIDADLKQLIKELGHKNPAWRDRAKREIKRGAV